MVKRTTLKGVYEDNGGQAVVNVEIPVITTTDLSGDVHTRYGLRDNSNSNGKINHIGKNEKGEDIYEEVLTGRKIIVDLSI